MKIGIATQSSYYFQIYKDELSSIISGLECEWLQTTDFNTHGRIDIISPSVILLDTLSEEIFEIDYVFELITEGNIPILFMENKISEFTQISSAGYYRSLAKKILTYETNNVIALPVKSNIQEKVVIICGGVGAIESMKDLVKEACASTSDISIIVLQQSNASGFNAIISMLRRVPKSEILSLVNDTKLKTNQVYVYHPSYVTTLSDFGMFLPKPHQQYNDEQLLSLNIALTRILKTSRSIEFDIVVLSGMDVELADAINCNRGKIDTIMVESGAVVPTMINTIKNKCAGVDEFPLKGILECMLNKPEPIPVIENHSSKIKNCLAQIE